jgi:hypothetical protein
VAVLSSGMALSDPTRTHRRQHRLCYDYAIMLFSFSAVPSVGSAKAEAHHYYVSFSATHLNWVRGVGRVTNSVSGEVRDGSFDMPPESKANLVRRVGRATSSTGGIAI